MKEQWRKLLDQPGNDLIVLPIEVIEGFVPLRNPAGPGYYLVARSCYDPDFYPPGSCIQ